MNAKKMKEASVKAAKGKWRKEYFFGSDQGKFHQNIRMSTAMKMDFTVTRMTSAQCCKARTYINPEYVDSCIRRALSIQLV